MRSTRQQPGNGWHNRATPRKGKSRAKRRQPMVAVEPGTTAKSPRKGTTEPSTTATEPQQATEPGQEGLTGRLSPERLETIGKVLPGIIKAVAVLVDAISKLLH
jgi:hypothetical protein